MFRCLSCEETFYDRETLLSHLGVKHNLINKVLKEKGWPEIKLDKVQIQLRSFIQNSDPRSRWNPVAVLSASPLFWRQRLKVQRPLKIAPSVKYVEPSSRRLSLDFRIWYIIKTNQVCGAKFSAINKLAQHMCAHYFSQVYNVLR